MSTVRGRLPASKIPPLYEGEQDGPLAIARFKSPRGLAVGRDGSIYVADTGNHTIRVISTSGDVTTLAGQAGVAGYVDAPGTGARGATNLSPSRKRRAFRKSRSQASPTARRTVFGMIGGFRGMRLWLWKRCTQRRTAFFA